MSTDYEMMLDVYGSLGRDATLFSQSDVAHLVVHQNKVIGANLVAGLLVEPQELDDGVSVRMVVDDAAVIARTVHLCFGVLPEEGRQRIELDVELRPRSRIEVLAHCLFPNAVDVTHTMEADIRVGEGASYGYLEQHVHGDHGGVLIVPRARVHVAPRASFETEFELVRGRVGRAVIDYEAHCAADARVRMVARIAGRGDDRIELSEKAHLDGPGAVGVLLSRIAVRDQAWADVYNELSASAPAARGHVDCKEIVQGNAVARATPVVDVRHPRARVTHEAAIGSVDSRQLQTLMARGVPEDDAVELIIQGLLARKQAPPAGRADSSAPGVQSTRLTG